MKICSKCKIEKRFDEFQSEKRKSDGCSARCKSCLNEDKKTYLDGKRDKIREYNRKKYYEDHEKQKSLRTERSKRNRTADSEKANRAKKNWYWKNIAKARKQAREYARKPEAMEKANETARKYRQSDKYKYKKRARSAFERAIIYGFIVRPDKCEKCLKQCKPDGHHEDYNKPLKVQWLCKTCHAQAHGKLKDLLEQPIPVPSNSDPI